MKTFFDWVAYLFEDILFSPFNALRVFAETNWAGSNGVNWLFLLIGFIAMIYWIRQLQIFDAKGEEDKDVTAHSFL